VDEIAMTQTKISNQELDSNVNYFRSQSGAISQPMNSGINPLPSCKTILYGLIPALILYLTHYYLVPAYVESAGIPYFKGYLAGYVLTMGMFFSAALIAFLMEGNPRSWEALKSRYRLVKMSRGDWWWVLGMIAITLLAYFGLSFTGNWVQFVPFLAPREGWPAEFGPGGTGQLVVGQFMGMSITGQWWVIGVYFLGWFLNIFGEEFWFRGYILPRQELAFGKRAWLVNGLMFTFNHLWQPWIMIAILPVSLLLAYVVQRRRNTWIGIIQHGVVNIGLLFYLAAGVTGLV
jgi:membrane protease YdiL (CAAX protease family)